MNAEALPQDVCLAQEYLTIISQDIDPKSTNLSEMTSRLSQIFREYLSRDFHISAREASSQEIIEQLESKVVSWRKGLAKPGEIVKDDIFRWYDELGDTTLLSKYFEIYINEFKRLANFPDEYTGVTGTAATNILKESGLLE